MTFNDAAKYTEKLNSTSSKSNKLLSWRNQCRLGRAAELRRIGSCFKECHCQFPTSDKRLSLLNDKHNGRACFPNDTDHRLYEDNVRYG